MPNPLIAKLEHGADLTDADRAVLADLTRQSRRVGARQDLIRQRERPEVVYLILDGFACRYKVLEDGSRQNMAYLVPGDFCDLHIAILSQMDHAIATLSPCTVVNIPHYHNCRSHRQPPAHRARALVVHARGRGHAARVPGGLGQREADQRMAHLFCELLLRLRAVGLADADSFALPLTQEEVGETLGISTVHVNRTLQTLRETGLITFQGRRVTIPDVARLTAYCEFEPSYLHLDARRREAAVR